MINALFWNVRGISKASHFRRLKNLVVSHKLQLLVVCETHVHVSRAEEYRIRLGFDCMKLHSAGLLWVFYQVPINCSVMGEGD